MRADRTPFSPQADAGYLQEGCPVTSARRMVVAMLTLVVDDISRYARRQLRLPNSPPRKDEREAIAWVADEHSTAPFSFRWCCDVLGLEIGGAREALGRLAHTGGADACQPPADQFICRNISAPRLPKPLLRSLLS